MSLDIKHCTEKNRYFFLVDILDNIIFKIKFMVLLGQLLLIQTLITDEIILRYLTLSYRNHEIKSVCKSHSKDI